MKRAASCIVALAVMTAAATASAHRVDAHISRAGIEFLEELVPAYVPEEIAPPDMARSFLCAEAVQRDTIVELELHELSLDMPRDGVLRLELEISVDAEGELYLNNLYSCFGEETCRDELSLSHARAVVEFQIEVAQGEPRLTINDVDLLVEPEDIEVRLSGCSIDGVVNTVIGWAQSLALDFILGFIGDAAANEMAPMIEEMLAGFATFEGEFGPAELAASLRSAHVGTDGISVGADVEVRSNLAEPAACLERDVSPPATKEGLPPDLAAGVPAHVGVAINLGLIEDVLYNAWRAGLMCLSDRLLAAFGIDLELDYHVGKLLPGFPPDTRYSLEVRLMEPPRVQGSESDEAALTLSVRGLEADLIGRYSGGSDTIHIVADLEASARLAVDREISALVLRPEAVRISRLVIDDVVGDRSLGLDAARLAHMLETHIVPKIVDELGAVPVSGSIVGYEDLYVLLRDVFTTEGYLAAKVDLFRAPDDDTGLPTTAIERRPEGLVSLEDAVIRVTGSDPEIPAELLRYRVVVDGEERPLSFVRDVPIGRAGVSARHRVEVSAVDLAGNEDPDPIVLHVDVDGIAPSVRIDGGAARDVSGVKETITWHHSDDITSPEEIVPRVLVYQLRDPSDVLDAELLSDVELPPGTTSYDLPVGGSELYRIEVRVRDEAGNEGVASVLLSQSSGGCAVGLGGGSGASALMILLACLGAAAMRRRPA